MQSINHILNTIASWSHVEQRDNYSCAVYPWENFSEGKHRVGLIIRCVHVFLLFATFLKALLQFVLQFLEFCVFDLHGIFVAVCFRFALYFLSVASLDVISLWSLCESCPTSYFRHNRTSISLLLFFDL